MFLWGDSHSQCGSFVQVDVQVCAQACPCMEAKGQPSFRSITKYFWKQGLFLVGITLAEQPGIFYK